jgi:biotin synthase
MDNFNQLLEHLTQEGVKGNAASIDDCMKLAESALATNADGTPTDEAERQLNALCDAADRVRQAHGGNSIDTCSIVNGRSGRCTENCKWCAQAAAHHTGCKEYDFIDEKEFFRALDVNTARGVKRFSIVCSGRKVAMKDLRHFCDLYRRAGERSNISLCASMGLLNREEMQELYNAGIRRYHCNIETAASYFPHLCTSHTREDKLRTIQYAKEVGMEVCSGGIIGMGETLHQRLEMAQEARDAGACSMPINLLSPIKGTPLENTPLISERDVILSVALMRLVAPKLILRFAGGRARLSKEATSRILRGGMNGALVGDMLTTVGNDMDADMELFRSHGFDA